MADNPLLAVMKRYKAPMTREEFEKLRYMGEVPEQIPGEDEAETPEQFQLPEEKEETEKQAAMKEGVWINVKDGRAEWVNEHASWAQNKANADKIGIPEHVWMEIKNIPAQTQGPRRDSILRKIMDHGFLRVRGHGSHISIEFTADTKDALWAAWEWLQKVAGPYTNVLFNNLRTGESTSATYQDFDRQMREDDSQILRKP
jgi:hypothetical protein